MQGLLMISLLLKGLLLKARISSDTFFSAASRHGCEPSKSTLIVFSESIFYVKKQRIFFHLNINLGDYFLLKISFRHLVTKMMPNIWQLATMSIHTIQLFFFRNLTYAARQQAGKPYQNVGFQADYADFRVITSCCDQSNLLKGIDKKNVRRGHRAY